MEVLLSCACGIVEMCGIAEKRLNLQKCLRDGFN